MEVSRRNVQITTETRQGSLVATTLMVKAVKVILERRESNAVLKSKYSTSLEVLESIESDLGK